MIEDAVLGEQLSDPELTAIVLLAHTSKGTDYTVNWTSGHSIGAVVKKLVGAYPQAPCTGPLLAVYGRSRPTVDQVEILREWIRWAGVLRDPDSFLFVDASDGAVLSLMDYLQLMYGGVALRCEPPQNGIAGMCADALQLAVGTLDGWCAAEADRTPGGHGHRIARRQAARLGGALCPGGARRQDHLAAGTSVVHTRKQTRFPFAV